MATIKGIWVFHEYITDVDINETVNFSTPDYDNGVNSFIRLRHYEYPGDGWCTSYYWTENSSLGAGDYGSIDENKRTVDFGSTPQEVSDTFYTWMTANAAPALPVKMLKAGTYRFNDVLTAIDEAFIQNISFTVKCNVNIPAIPEYGFDGYIGTHTFTGSQIIKEPVSSTGNGSLAYTLISAKPAIPDVVMAGLELSFPISTYFYAGYEGGDGWEGYGSVFNGIQTITIPTDSEVSEDFATWFMANTVEVKPTIKAGTYHFNTTPARYPHDTEVDLKFTTQVSHYTFPYGAIVNFSKFDVSGFNAPDYEKLIIYWTVESTTPNLGMSGQRFWAYDDGDAMTNGWRDDYGYGILTITIPYDQEVPAVFYDWFMSSIEEQKHETTIKAGTYRFNAELTPPLFNEYVNLPFTIPDATFYLHEEVVSEVNQIAAVDPSLGSIQVGTYTWSFAFTGFQTYYYPAGGYSIINSLGMSSTCTNSSPILKYLGDTGWIVFQNEIYHTLHGSDINNAYQTITVLEDTMVSNDFAAWFTANAKQLSTITYKNTVIALESGQTATLHLTGHEMTEDMVIEAVANKGIPEWDGSYAVAEAGPKMINFTVAGASYQAEEGMTWGEWVDSEYNTDGFWEHLLDGVYCVATREGSGTQYAYGVAYNDAFVPIADLIVEGRAYTEKYGSHSGGSVD